MKQRKRVYIVYENVKKKKKKKRRKRTWYEIDTLNGGFGWKVVWGVWLRV